MSVLDFDKPKRLKPFQEHADYYSSDTNIAGTYVPNMSEEDRMKWKARQVGGDDPRVEIRKTVRGKLPGEQYGTSAQVLVVVRQDYTVTISANSRMIFGLVEWGELIKAVKEARDLLGLNT
jgi:hypothetical protein